MTTRFSVSLTGFMALKLSACGDDETNGADSSVDGRNDNQNIEAVEVLIQKTLDNMVFVEGGSFEMGDFGPIDPKTGGLPYSHYLDNKHLHTVTLDSYSISAYQVSYADYDVYTDSIGKEKINTEGSDGRFRAPNVPAGTNWYQAEDYCQWLANNTGLPFSLPTEAQWEYAARSRGGFHPFSTNNGQLEPGENFPTRDEIAQSTPANSSGPYTIGMYTPNPLGVYQMGLNGFEWVSDWYGERYYEESPERNPQGPDTGTEKIKRGASFSEPGPAKLNINRRSASPDLSIDVPGNLITHSVSRTNTIRCIINSKNPL